MESDPSSRQSRFRHAPRPTDAFGAALAASVFAGLAVARLTLKLNPHLADDLSDTLLLHGYLAAGYGAAGVVIGTLGAAAVALARRWAGRPAPRWLFATGVVALAGLAPLAFVVLLPDAGLGSELLTHVLAATAGQRALDLALIAALLVLAGWVLAVLLSALSRRLGTSVRVLLTALWLLGVAALALSVSSTGAAAADPRPGLESDVTQLPPAPEPPPPRVVLLCIDGADLDDVILPLVEAGELPHFAGLMRDGTWGPLATLEPTLSAVVWTTLITGKTPAEHGIRHFLHFRPPGIRQSVYEFPLHTGLNFHLFPLLEKIPGVPVMRAPYTGNMRRTQALWNIIGRRYSVGSYRWLITWPAEELNGFSVAGGIGWVQFSEAARQEVRKSLSGQPTWPPGLLRTLATQRRRPPNVSREELEAYVGEGYEIDRQDLRLKSILKTVTDPTAQDLPFLIEKFGVRFLASSFYPVDAAHHLFNVYRDRGGKFSGAIAEHYRLVDARLGELLAALEEPTQVIVVSDHGFDFEHHHHTHAPAGIFFARGPAFAAGRRLAELSVYDVAPLVLHLLDMPLPDDMPGARSGRYRSALSDDFLAAHPVRRIATYETARAASHEPVASPKDDEIREILESLGYVD